MKKFVLALVAMLTLAAPHTVAAAPAEAATHAQQRAVGKAKAYLHHGNFSLSGLIDQLEHDKFTHRQAVYGAKRAY